MSLARAMPSISRRWALGAACALLLAVAFLGVGAAARSTREAARASYQEQQLRLAQVLASRAGTVFQDHRLAVEGIALDAMPGDGGVAWLIGELARFGVWPENVRFAVWDARGRIVIEGGGAGSVSWHPHSASGSSACVTCLAAGHVVFTGPADAAGRHLSVAYPLKRLSSIMLDGHGWMVAPDGMILANSDSRQVGTRPFDSSVDDPRLTDMLAQMAAGGSGTGIYTWPRADGSPELRVAAFARVPEASPGVSVAVSTTLEDATSGVNRALVELLAAGAALLGAVFGAAAFGATLDRRAKEAENRLLAERLEMVEAASHAERLALVGTLAAGVAHDLRSPLASLQVNADLLRKSVDGELWAIVEDIRAAAGQIASIARDLGAFTRRTEGHGWCDPRKAVETAVRLAGATLGRRRPVEVRLGALPPVHIGEQRLAQVVTNLLVNAAHAGRRIEVSATATDQFVTLFVDDDGSGVPEPLRERIFEPFVTTRAPGEGTGLGLFLCRRFVEEAAGTIAVEDGPLGGARFAVTLRRVMPVVIEESA